MKNKGNQVLFALFILGLGAMLTIPGEKIVLGTTIFSYSFVLISYGLFLGLIAYSFKRIPTLVTRNEQIVFFGIISLTYLTYGLMAQWPLLKIGSGLILFAVLTLAGFRVITPPSFFAYIIFVIVLYRVPYFNAPLINYYADDKTAVLKLNLYHLILDSIVIFNFYFRETLLFKQLDLEIRVKDLLLAIGLFFVVAVVDIPIGIMTHFLQISFHPIPFEIWFPRIFNYFGMVALVEEILFRGMLLGYLANLFPKQNKFGIPLLISALVFGAAHIYPPAYILLSSFAGYMYGAAYLITGRLSTSIMVHALVDITWKSVLFVMV